MGSFFLEPAKRGRPSTAAGGTGRKPHKPRNARGLAAREKRVQQEEELRHLAPGPKAKGRAANEELGLGEGDQEGVEDLDLQGASGPESEVENSEEERETPAAKRLRLAKRYLAKVRESTAVEGEFDAADIDRDLISERLRDDALERAGRLFTRVADRYAALVLPAGSLSIRDFKSGKHGHALSVTGVAFAAPARPVLLAPAAAAGATPSTSVPDASPMYLYSCSKDASIIKWDFRTGQRVCTFVGGIKPTKRIQKTIPLKHLNAQVGHSDEVLCLAVSPDGQFLASGGRDKSVRIWSTQEDKHLTAFKHHRDTVSALAFRKHGAGHRDMDEEAAAATSTSSPRNQLYSASHDRTVKLWNVDELAYIETLFGHQDNIAAIDALVKEHCITTGSRDRTVRLWKIIEESQLIFRAGGSAPLTEEAVVMDGMRPKGDAKRAHDQCGSVDVVCMLDEETFVSGSDSGALSLWTVHRKKPLFTRPDAHGPRAPSVGAQALPPVDASVAECTWITALAAQPFTDLFASGSCDGVVRLWKLAEGKKAFALVNVIPVAGFINQLAFFEAPPAESVEDSTTVERRKVRRGGADGAVLHLAAAIGQEHRLGRWWKCKEAKNGVKVITLG